MKNLIILCLWCLTTTLSAQLKVTIQVTNPSCFGSKTGKLEANVTGGTLPYTISWSTGETGPTLLKQGAGFYTVTVKDAVGTIVTENAGLTDPSKLKITVDAIIPASYLGWSGGNNGQIKITPLGGNSPYSEVYTRLSYWPVMNEVSAKNIFNDKVVTYNSYVIGTDTTNKKYYTEDISNLQPGKYLLHLVDNNGCPLDTTLTVQNLAPFTAIPIKDSLDCYRSNNARNGWGHMYGQGTHPFGYVSSLAPKDTIWMYDVSFTDSHGIFHHVDTLKNGTIIADADSATVFKYTVPPWYTKKRSYEINLQRTVTTRNYEGFLWEEILSSDGRMNIIYVTNTYPSSQLSLTGSGKDIRCFGGKGDVSVSASGSYGGGNKGVYFYKWTRHNPVTDGDDYMGNTNALYNVIAGVYNVTVHDSIGCSDVAVVTITDPSKMLIDLDTVRPTCNGKTNGKITAIAKGGQGTPDYFWSKTSGGAVVSTDRMITGIGAGKWYLKVVDTYNCTVDTSLFLSEPGLLKLIVSNISSVKCNGDETGSAIVTYTGGTPPVQGKISRNGVTYADYLSSNIPKLPAGNYGVDISDYNKCPAQDSFVISEPQPLVVKSVVQNALCYDSLGSGKLIPSGGVVPYTTNWDDGNANLNRLLKKGDHYWTITDNNLCKKDSVMHITQPDIIQGNLIVVGDVKCSGDATVNVNLTVYGGTNKFTYAWLPTGKTTKNLNQVGAGTHIIRATDSNGCLWTDSTTIQDKLPLKAVITDQKNVSCFGGSDASLTLSLSGGTPGYVQRLYDAKNTEIQTVSSGRFIGLSAGTYQINTSDVNTCSTVLSVIITQSDSISVTTSITDVVCYNGNSGALNVSVKGGSGKGFDISWRPSSAQGFNPCNLSSGDYIADIRDKSNSSCFVQKTYYINSPKQMPDIKWYLENCSRVTNKEKTVVLTGQDGRFVINDVWWLTVVPLSEETFMLLDKSGKRINRKPGALQYPIEFSDLDTGNYVLYTKSINGCVWETHFSILLSNVIKELPWYTSFSPNGDGTNDVWNIPEFWRTITSKVNIYDPLSGDCVYTSSILGYPDPWNGKKNNDGKDCPEGFYRVIVLFDQDGKITRKESIIFLKRKNGY